MCIHALLMVCGMCTALGSAAALCSIEMLSVAGWRTAWVLTDCVRSQADSCGDAVLVRQSEVG